MCRPTRSLTRLAQQQGVALITALVIMAIAVSIAATLAYRQQVSIRLAGNLGALEQAYQYATALETWAGTFLTEDHKKNDTDSLKDEWATLLPPQTIPGGYMNGQLFDLQGRLNVNDLLTVSSKNGQKTKVKDKDHVQRLTVLFAKLKVPPKELIDNLLDWLDENDQVSNNGAESGYYKTLEEPYLAANSSLVSLSELRLIKGYNKTIKNDKGEEESIFWKIAPFLSVLPISDLPANRIKINVNTASEEVLFSLGLDQTQVDHVMTDRETEPFPNVADFVSTLSIQNSSNFPKDHLSVNTHYFLLQGIVEIGKVRIFINSTIYRDNSGRTRVIRREFNES